MSNNNEEEMLKEAEQIKKTINTLKNDFKKKYPLSRLLLLSNPEDEDWNIITAYSTKEIPKDFQQRVNRNGKWGTEGLTVPIVSNNILESLKGLNYSLVEESLNRCLLKIKYMSTIN